MPLGFSLFDRGVSFSPERDIPDLTGKVIFITGGNVGLGKETALQLSKHHPKHIYLSARNESKALAAIQDIQNTVPDDPAPISFIQCDLASLPSIQSAAREFTTREDRLDILILNAGIMATPPALTPDGYEEQFGTNHLGHALLTKLLLPTLLRTATATATATTTTTTTTTTARAREGEVEGEVEGEGADVRVISLSSIGHLFAPLGSGIDFAALKTDMRSAFTLARYAQSKLANILFVKELAARYPGTITAVAVHPGVVDTELYRCATRWFVLGGVIAVAKTLLYTSVADGAKGQLWAATAPLMKRKKPLLGREEGVESGEFYTPVGVCGQGSALSNDAGLARRLWEWTEKELEGYTL